MSRITACVAVSMLMMSASLTLDAQGINIGGNEVLTKSSYGLKTSKRSWEGASCSVVEEKSSKIKEDYTMITGKRSHCQNEGTEHVYKMVNPKGDILRLVVRQYTDGYAFRYELNDVAADEVIEAENTRYTVPANANRWMQQYNGPGYEHFFPLCPGGVSPEGEKVTKWGYPALFEMSADCYMLITDSYNFRDNCGSILTNTQQDRNTYSVQMFGTDRSRTGLWHSAWHVIIAGTLADVVESTLVTDVADPCTMKDTKWIQPGVSSWIYWAHNHGSQDYNILKDYVDLAAYMKWPYTLVDAEWDVMRGGDIEGLVKYAISKGVKPMIWYNSTTNWTGQSAPTPQGRLNEPAMRDAEFGKIASWGVKGVKIDFFREDNRETTQYYYDLLLSAAMHRLLVNFHGGTIPHGWQRTYPWVITCEGVYGAEWYNNNGVLTNKAACHNATLPFTRNVIGPMDYTPGTFTDSQHPHVTTDAHELALTILFESGIQHMPDRPETYRALPSAASDILSSLPTAWDDTKLLAGYPGKSVVLARRKGSTWYIAGINGQDEDQVLKFDLRPLKKISGKGIEIVDTRDNKSFAFNFVKIKSELARLQIPCKARGGFVLVVK